MRDRIRPIDLQRLHPDDLQLLAAILAAQLAPLLDGGLRDADQHDVAAGFELASEACIGALGLERPRQHLRLAAINGEII